MSPNFTLHPQLAAECIVVGDLPLTRVLLNDDANYPWLVLVPRRPALVDLIDLADNDQIALVREASDAARALKVITNCHKLNVAALGNQVPQLHVHVIARFRTDAAWPDPVWGRTTRKAYETSARERLLEAVRRELRVVQSPAST
ncbi:MAG TPA: HIT family protein [Pseudolabrys sp.]|jgi:diadenosine tetraphosphate (Ap4A) HIT family hydrolase|nr:HIT family protein [Pseudolabrys sp.]